MGHEYGELVKSRGYEKLSFSWSSSKTNASAAVLCRKYAYNNREDRHFIWKDMQLSKGQLNRDRLITVETGNKKKSVPCLKRMQSCGSYKREVCPTHSSVLQKI